MFKIAWSAVVQLEDHVVRNLQRGAIHAGAHNDGTG
jgi:hypothetical protein